MYIYIALIDERSHVLKIPRGVNFINIIYKIGNIVILLPVVFSYCTQQECEPVFFHIVDESSIVMLFYDKNIYVRFL